MLHKQLIDLVCEYIPIYLLQPWIEFIITYSSDEEGNITYTNELVIIRDKLPKEIKKYTDPVTHIMRSKWIPTEDNIKCLQERLNGLIKRKVKNPDGLCNNVNYNIKTHGWNLYKDRLIFIKYTNNALNFTLGYLKH